LGARLRLPAWISNSPPPSALSTVASAQSAPLFQDCRAAPFAAGEPLLKRAQDAGVVRPDVEFSEVMHMVIGIGKIPAADQSQIDHILRIALDGLRYRPST
jgi:hypothetical protein